VRPALSPARWEKASRALGRPWAKMLRPPALSPPMVRTDLPPALVFLVLHPRLLAGSAMHDRRLALWVPALPELQRRREWWVRPALSRARWETASRALGRLWAKMLRSLALSPPMARKDLPPAPVFLVLRPRLLAGSVMHDCPLVL
jgi:hypothetical protein